MSELPIFQTCAPLDPHQETYKGLMEGDFPNLLDQLLPQEKTAQSYKPFPVDWRFLPEPVLLAKDTLRHVYVETIMALSHMPVARVPWARLARSRVLKPALSAGKLFIHIPKTGGTSICSLLYKRNIPHLTADFILNVYGKECADLPSFSILRHPVDRLVSAYHFLKNGGTSIMACSRFEMARVGDLRSFETFVARLEDKPSLMQRALALMPQHEFICDKTGHLIVDRLFALSSVHSMGQLRHWLNAASLPHLNASERDHVSLDQATVRRIERLYERDFEIFDQIMSQPIPA